MCFRKKILIFEGKRRAFAGFAREHMFFVKTLRFTRALFGPARPRGTRPQECQSYSLVGYCIAHYAFGYEVFWRSDDECYAVA